MGYYVLIEGGRVDHICGRVYSGGRRVNNVIHVGGQFCRGGGRVNNVNHGGGRINNVTHVGGQLNLRVITIGCTFRSTIIIPIIGHFTVEWSCTYFRGTKSPYSQSNDTLE